MERALAAGPDHDSIVAEPPPLIRHVMPLVFFAGVACAWYFWSVLSNGGGVRVDALVLTAIAILCGTLWLLNGRRRVVMDHACIAEYRGGKLLRRYSLREITALRQEINAVRFVFGDRGAITIPNIWPGANDIHHRLQSVIDLHTGPATPVDDWLPVNYVTFPPRCVSCGSHEVIAHSIFAGTKYHLPNVSWTRGWNIAVPACAPCSRRRKVAGLVTGFVLIVGGVGLVLAAAISERFQGTGLGPFLIGFVMVLVLVQVAVNSIPRRLDQRFLGVAALRLGKDKTTVRLWFRNGQEEVEVRTLTAENRSREMSSTAENLRAL